MAQHDSMSQAMATQDGTKQANTQRSARDKHSTIRRYETKKGKRQKREKLRQSWRTTGHDKKPRQLNTILSSLKCDTHHGIFHHRKYPEDKITFRTTCHSNQLNVTKCRLEGKLFRKLEITFFTVSFGNRNLTYTSDIISSFQNHRNSDMDHSAVLLQTLQDCSPPVSTFKDFLLLHEGKRLLQCILCQRGLHQCIL